MRGDFCICTEHKCQGRKWDIAAKEHSLHNDESKQTGWKLQEDS